MALDRVQRDQRAVLMSLDETLRAESLPSSAISAPEEPPMAHRLSPGYGEDRSTRPPEGLSKALCPHADDRTPQSSFLHEPFPYRFPPDIPHRSDSGLCTSPVLCRSDAITALSSQPRFDT